MSEIRCEKCKGKQTPRCEECLQLEEKMNKDWEGFMRFVCWFFGVGWVLAGLPIIIDDSVVGGAIVILGGLIVIPFTREKFNVWLNKKDDTLSINNKKAFGFAVICIFIHVLFFAPPPTAEELAAKAERAQIIAKEKQEKEQAEKSAEREEECQDKIMPSVKAEMFVKNQLKSPSTADFPFFNANRIEYAGNCTHKINSYVDSQNAFGAIVRTQYYLEIKRGETENDWELIDFKFQTVQ